MKPTALAMGLVWGFVVAGGGGVRAATAERPNVVFIFADDVGWGDLGCYGATNTPASPCR
jgi:hypothetical protein